jgi:hypothetical protein
VEINNTATKKTDSIALSLREVVTLHARGQTRTINRALGTSQVAGFEPCFYGMFAIVSERMLTHKWQAFALFRSRYQSTHRRHHARVVSCKIWCVTDD